MEKEKLLLGANIPKKLWKYCTIANGIIYTPSVEKQIELGIIEEDYKKQIDICEPTDRERMDQLEGMVGMLAEQVAKQSLGM